MIGGRSDENGNDPYPQGEQIQGGHVEFDVSDEADTTSITVVLPRAGSA